MDACAGFTPVTAEMTARCLRSYFSHEYPFYTSALRRDRSAFALNVQAQAKRTKRSLEGDFEQLFWHSMTNTCCRLLSFYWRNCRFAQRQDVVYRGMLCRNREHATQIAHSIGQGTTSPVITSLSGSQAMRFTTLPRAVERKRYWEIGVLVRLFRNLLRN